MEMSSKFVCWQTLKSFKKLFRFLNVPSTNCISKWYLVTTHVQQFINYPSYLRWSDLSIKRAAHNHWNITSYSNWVSSSLFNDWHKPLETFFDRAVQIFLGKSFSSRSKNGDFFNSNLYCGLHTLSVGYKTWIINLWLFLYFLINLFRVSHLRDPFCWYKRPYLDSREPCFGEFINEVYFFI
jgi:hypothetical protein